MDFQKALHPILTTEMYTLLLPHCLWPEPVFFLQCHSQFPSMALYSQTILQHGIIVNMRLDQCVLNKLHNKMLELFSNSATGQLSITANTILADVALHSIHHTVAQYSMRSESQVLLNANVGMHFILWCTQPLFSSGALTPVNLLSSFLLYSCQRCCKASEAQLAVAY